MLAEGHTQKQPKQQLRMTRGYFLVILLVIVCFGSFVVGYEMVAVTMLEREIGNINGLSKEELHYYLTLATAMMPLGAILGCLANRQLENLLGDNRLMMLSDIVVVGSCLLAVRTLTVPNLCVSRLLVGLSCGVSSSLIPPFLMSLSPPEWRGLAGSLHQLFVTVGVGFSFYLGQRLEDLTIFGVTNWRSYLFLPALYACVRTLMLLFFRFNKLEDYYENGDAGKLKQFMRLFYNRVDVKQLVISRRFTKEKAEQTREGFLGMDGKRMTVAVVLLALNQLSGINIVLPYSKQLFMKVSYYHEEGANYYLEVLAVAQVIATLAGGWLANKYGRKRVLLAGGHVATATLFAIFAVSTLSPRSVMLLVGLIVLFTIAYAGTVGVVPLLYLAELFPTLSGVNTIYWAFSLVGMLSSNPMLSHLGIGKSFFIYGTVSFLCTYFLESEMIESHCKTNKELTNEYLYHNKDEGSVLQYASMKNTDAIIEDSNSLIDLEQ